MVGDMGGNAWLLGLNDDICNSFQINDGGILVKGSSRLRQEHLERFYPASLLIIYSGAEMPPQTR